MVSRVCVVCGVVFGKPKYRLKQKNCLVIYCSMRCYSAARSNATPEKFWALAARSPNGCLEWSGGLDGIGYGVLRVAGGRREKAHRHAWWLTHGDIPAGLLVCHRCDNPRCIEPSHLFLGTHQDNNEDMWRKGRAVDRNGRPQPPREPRRRGDESRGLWEYRLAPNGGQP